MKYLQNCNCVISEPFINSDNKNVPYCRWCGEDFKMNKIDQIIKAKKFLVEKGYNLNDTLKPLKVAELIIDDHEKQLMLADVVGQSEHLFCAHCGSKKQLKVETDLNSDRVCKSRLCAK